MVGSIPTSLHPSLAETNEFIEATLVSFIGFAMISDCVEEYETPDDLQTILEAWRL